MSDSSVSAFNQRVKSYVKHNPCKQVYVPGQGVVYKRRGVGLRFPRYLVLLVVAMIFGMKTMIVLELGEYEYNQRLSKYSEPTTGEQIGLYLMKADPLTLKLRDLANVVFIQ